MDSSAPQEPSARRPNWPLHVVLFLVTLASTTYMGLNLVEDAPESMSELLSMPRAWGTALAYSLSVLAILFAHEMGHYLTARHYNVDASPPYFLPGFPPFGTFGAFIRMRIESISARRLFWIGAGGPYAGFVVALPLLVLGLWMSEIKDLPPELVDAKLGDSLLMMGLVKLVHGTIPAGKDVFLHPIAYAGWVGMFVTSFNLVPLGQLDGGHIAYTLFGERFNKVAIFLLVALIAVALLVFPGWGVLVLFLLYTGYKHPPIARGEVLQGKSRVAAYGALLLFVLTFVPQPFSLDSPVEMLLQYVSGDAGS